MPQPIGPELPQDSRGGNLPLPPTVLLASASDTSVDTATSFTIHPVAEIIEVTALTQALYVAFNADPTSSSFVAVIPAGTTRHFPARDNNGTRWTTIRVLAVTSGAAAYVSQV